MSLPFFTQTNNNSFWEPIYKNLFDVNYSTSDISKQECDILREHTYKIKDDKLFINANYNDDYNILTILNKLKKFSLDINVHDKKGYIIYKLVFRNCEFIDFVYDIEDLERGSSDLLRPELRIKYESKEYIDSSNYKLYKRRKKIERLITENSIIK